MLQGVKGGRTLEAVSKGSDRQWQLVGVSIVEELKVACAAETAFARAHCHARALMCAQKWLWRSARDTHMTSNAERL